MVCSLLKTDLNGNVAKGHAASLTLRWAAVSMIMPTGRPSTRRVVLRMDIRPLTPDFAVSPQIDPEDLPAIAAAGYRRIINNRPCSEIPPSHQNEAMKAAADAAGVDFVTLPVTHTTMTLDTVRAQRAAIDTSPGPVLAYCASGTRSTIVWALGQAGDREADDIVKIAAEHGYDLSQMRAQLTSMGAV